VPEEACGASLPDAGMRSGITDYRPSHTDLLADLYAPDRPAIPQTAVPLTAWGPLLGEPQPGRSAKRGGILLPVSRNLSQGLSGLSLAADLALAHDCSLLVICSRQAKVLDFPAVLRDKLGELLILVDLADVKAEWLPPLRSSEHLVNKFRKPNDVGSKRNIGLAAALALGWEYLMFMDDDIYAAEAGPTLSPEYLAHALLAMQQDPHLKAIGWTLEEFNDNSVVGHARRFVGLPQGVFIGGGALLVRCDPQMPFFPDIYNEDWLFLIALLKQFPKEKHVLAWAGAVHQRPYAPFRVHRAVSEEAGEIVGECLMNLVEDRESGSGLAMSPSYWRSALASRRQLLQTIRARVSALAKSSDPVGALTRTSLIGAMVAAEKVHHDIKPLDLASFVRAWDDDEAVWHRHLAGLRTRIGASVEEQTLLAALTNLPARPGEVTRLPSKEFRKSPKRSTTPAHSLKEPWARPRARQLEPA
jgi:hypothetical protein